MENPQAPPKPQAALAPRHVLRLPGFLNDEPIGLGDLIKRATSAAGIKPCGGCTRRAERLNTWVGLSRPQALR